MQLALRLVYDVNEDQLRLLVGASEQKRNFLPRDLLLPSEKVFNLLKTHQFLAS